MTNSLTVGADQRAATINQLKERRHVAREAQCNYWIFEDASTQGTLLEFIEARDEATLRRAHALLGDTAVTQIFLEVEL